MTFQTFAISSILFTTGCYASAYTIHTDPGFAPTVLDAAHGAVADWEANVPVKIAFSSLTCPILPASGKICLHPVSSIPTLPWESGTLAGFTLFYNTWLVESMLEAGPPAYRQRVIAHELGHQMGLNHTGPGSLMFPYSEGGSWVVTPTDVAQWRSAHGLK